eukprot:TRINITY_DN2958_c0_g1_i1.p1 TRINITY_DN2958_c0_g1~~TRINITY_DN2958_c0_g1_i1.p1  ORF type:complete len:141 (+),score=3.73 TRINITY_DN2958_c0_g1_i1:293-715(+)
MRFMHSAPLTKHDNRATQNPDIPHSFTGLFGPGEIVAWQAQLTYRNHPAGGKRVVTGHAAGEIKHDKKNQQLTTINNSIPSEELQACSLSNYWLRKLLQKDEKRPSTTLDEVAKSTNYKFSKPTSFAPSFSRSSGVLLLI